MRRFLAIRFLQTLVALFAITLIVFGLTHLTGSPVDALLPDDASQEQIESLIRHWGLDRPLHEQYLAFLGNALQGDLGVSLKWRGYTAMEVVLQRLPATLKLGGLSVLISILAAIPLGVIAARHRGTMVDKSANVVALLGQSLPQFWLGIMLIWIFAVGLGWFPTSGQGGLEHMILPAVAMASFQIAALTRLTRSAMLDTLRSGVHQARSPQGRLGAQDHLEARAAKRGDRPPHLLRAAFRLPSHRLGRHRIGVRMARHGTPFHRGDPGPRLPGGAGRGHPSLRSSSSPSTTWWMRSMLWSILASAVLERGASEPPRGDRCA